MVAINIHPYGGQPYARSTGPRPLRRCSFAGVSFSRRGSSVRVSVSCALRVSESGTPFGETPVQSDRSPRRNRPIQVPSLAREGTREVEATQAPEPSRELLPHGERGLEPGRQCRVRSCIRAVIAKRSFLSLPKRLRPTRRALLTGARRVCFCPAHRRLHREPAAECQHAG